MEWSHTRLCVRWPKWINDKIMMMALETTNKNNSNTINWVSEWVIFKQWTNSKILIGACDALLRRLINALMHSTMKFVRLPTRVWRLISIAENCILKWFFGSRGFFSMQFTWIAMASSSHHIFEDTFSSRFRFGKENENEKKKWLKEIMKQSP